MALVGVGVPGAAEQRQLQERGAAGKKKGTQARAFPGTRF